jgi:regulatory protein
VKSYSDPNFSLRERALRFLARREHSRRELERKLAPHAESPAELQSLLDDLEGKKQLCDRRYAEGRARVLARKYGAARIEHDLRAHGVAGEAADAAALDARATEFDRAREVWRRKFGQAAANIKERARQARFLQGRGFSAEVINRVLRLEDE